MLMPISALAAQQAKPTQATMKRVQHFLDYAATQEPAVTTYRASDMVLAIHSNAGYLNEERARSRAGGHHFLSENVPNPANNGAIYNEASIIKSVMSSAAEAKSVVYKCTQRSRDLTHIGRVGAQTAPHPRPNRQFHCRRHNKLTSTTKAHKSHGYAFPLATRPRGEPKTISFLLATRLVTARGLLDEAPPPAHHRNMRGEILTPYKHEQHTHVKTT
eukprot:CCRYP_004051-RA/>CCRYP_004051-RA protein AED:0.45 eAED:0.43 QI:0/0/0/1/0/0/2/0/216